MASEAALATAAAHFAAFLAALGLATGTDPHLEGTPERVARLYAEVFSPRDFAFTMFPAEGVDQMVVVRDIPVTAFCAHHLLPFTGVAHVGYVPTDRVAGLSKLARAVAACAAKPQVQERLTEEIADLLVAHLDPRGVGVVVRARHACMELRGIRATGALTVTSAVRGLFRADPSARAEFLALAGSGGEGG